MKKKDVSYHNLWINSKDYYDLFCLIVYCRGQCPELPWTRDTQQNTIIRVCSPPQGDYPRWVPVNSTARLDCRSRQEHLRIWNIKL